MATLTSGEGAELGWGSFDLFFLLPESADFSRFPGCFLVELIALGLGLVGCDRSPTLS